MLITYFFENLVHLREKVWRELGDPIVDLGRDALELHGSSTWAIFPTLSLVFSFLMILFATIRGFVQTPEDSPMTELHNNGGRVDADNLVVNMQHWLNARGQASRHDFNMFFTG